MTQLEDPLIPQGISETPRRRRFQIQAFIIRMMMLVIGVSATVLLTLGWAAFLVCTAWWVLRS